MSKDLSQSEDHKTTTLCGSHGYIAPEVYSGARYGIKADVWAFGVLIYEMTEKKLMIEAEDSTSLKQVKYKQAFLISIVDSADLKFLISILRKHSNSSWTAIQ